MHYLKNTCFAVILFSCSSVFSQRYYRNLLIPYRSGNLWGYCDTLGNIKIPPAYNSVSFFKTDFPIVKVTLNDKETFITEDNKLFVPLFDTIIELQSYFFIVSENNKFGIYYGKQLVVPLIYDRFIYPSWQQLRDSYDIVAVKDGKYWLVNYQNKTVKELASYKEFNDWEAKAEGVVEVLVNSNNDNKDIQTVTVKPAPDQPNAATADSLKRIMDLDSVTTIELIDFTSKGFFRNKYFKLFKNGKTGLLNKGFLIKPKYSEITAIYESQTLQIIVSKKKKYGMIDEHEHILIPIQYDSIQKIKENLFITTRNRKKGVIFLNSSYKEIKNKYDQLKLARYVARDDYSRDFFEVFEVEINGRMGYIGKNGVEYFAD